MSAQELLPCPFCGVSDHLSAIKTGSAAGHYYPYAVVCRHLDCDDVRGPTGNGKHEAIAAWNRRTPPAMSADHIGGASPAVTEVGKLIQAPLVEKLVGALKRLATATERLMAAWPDTHVPGGKLCVEVSEALNDAKALAHIPDAGNMVAPVEALSSKPVDDTGEANSSVKLPVEVVSVRRRILAGWLLSPQLNEDEATNVVANYPAIQAYTHPAPIKPSDDTGELRERVAEAKEWIDEAECRRGCSTWRPDVHGRSRCDCGREAAADAILDIIQSERAG